MPHFLTVVRGRPPMSSRAEVSGNRAIGGEEPLRMFSRLEPLHLALPLAGGLMRVLRAVNEIPMLAVLHARQYCPLGSTIAFELVRDDHPRNVPAALEQLAEESLGGLLVPPALHQNVEDIPLLIDRTPEVAAFPIHREEHFI